jgi:hypothetical protein
MAQQTFGKRRIAAMDRNAAQQAATLFQSAYQDADHKRKAMQTALVTLRDNILNDPDQDNDTINWALSHIDAVTPETWMMES